MIRRFCLYGFLKNQRYFEPFIILAFLEKGLTFLDIGWLIGFREICILILEIPSGAIADIFGRRRSMIFSFISYIISFALFATAAAMPLLMGAMFFFAVGDAFRTGTHKAMIFEWLRLENRLDERTKVYGYTRSWSKFGSAISSLIAGALVMISGTFSIIFWLSVVPYILNLLNFLGYPKSLEGEHDTEASLNEAFRLTGRALRESTTRPRLRRLIIESMMLEGVFKVTSGYLQPVLRSLALGLPLFALSLQPEQRGAMVIGVVCFFYFMVMAFASRRSHFWAQKLGGEEQLTRLMWFGNFLVFMLMGMMMMAGLTGLVVVAFMALGVIQNTFRPAQITRFNQESSPEMGATILSIESQSKSLAAAVLAPLLGWTVDKGISDSGLDVKEYWPVAVLGLVVSALVLVFQRSRISLTRSRSAD